MSILNVGQMSSAIQSGKISEWTKSKNPTDVENVAISDLPTKTGESFGDFLKNSLTEVNNMQQVANKSMEALASGKEQSLHEVMMAVEKADIAFKTMNQVRGKVIEAYKEIMRMQI
jgi:flagellar hook-basal body complex protein FliE